MASSTSSSGTGSPRTCIDSSIARCATLPRAVGTVQPSKPASSSARKRTSHPDTDDSRCLVTHSCTMPSVSSIGTSAASCASRSSRRAARRPGSNTGRSSGAARSAFSNSSCAGLSVRVSSATPQPYAGGTTANAGPGRCRVCASRPVTAVPAHSTPDDFTVTPLGDDGRRGISVVAVRRRGSCARARGAAIGLAHAVVPQSAAPRGRGAFGATARRTAMPRSLSWCEDRPWPAVLADMVEGIVVANHLHGPDADRARARLWSSVGSGETVAA